MTYVTVAGTSAWRSCEPAMAARELEQTMTDCAIAHTAVKKAERELAEYFGDDRLT